MSAAALLARVRALGVRVRLSGNNIALRPIAAVPEDLKAAIKAHKLELLALLREEAGPAHGQEIRDLFERITLYEMKAHDATAHRLADGRYEVSFVVDGKKLYADGAGRETEAPLDELFDVGAFTVAPGSQGYNRDAVVKLERVAVRTGRQRLTMVLDRLPKLVGIDPLDERIDRTPDVHLTPVKLE